MNDKVYCEHAAYIENEFICWYTGKPCTITPLPSRYMCSIYSRKNSAREEEKIFKNNETSEFN